MAPSETHCKCVTSDCIAIGVVFVLTLCLCQVLSVDLLWVGVVSVDWSVVCGVFSCSELKCCVLCNLYTFLLPF